MATQTGSIDLEATNAAKLYAEAGFASAGQTYATKSELTVSANNIKAEVAETYATKSEAQPTNTGSGAVISTDDCAALPPVGITVWGNSTQDGTPSPSSPVEIQSVEGRNLLKTVAESVTLNGVAFTVNADATVTMRGTATVLTDIWLSQAASSKNLIYVPAGSYTLSASKELPSGVHLICSGGGQNGYGYKDLSGVMTHTSTVTDASKPFSYFLFRINSGTTVDDTIGVMLEADTQATDFTPYGSIGLATNGVNIIDVADVASTTLTNTYYYELTYANKKMPRFNLEAGTTYTLSATVQTDVVPFQMSVGCGVSAYSCDITNKGYDAAGRVSITFTPTAAQLESGTVLAFRAPRYSAKQTFTFSLSDIQLEYGGTAHDYEPCSTTITPIDLQGNQLRSLPDGTRDELRVGERVTLVKRVGVRVFDGSESWNVNPNVGSGFAYTPKPTDMASGDGAASVPLMRVDRFEPKHASTGGIVYASGSNLLFYRDGSTFNPSNTTDAKAWFTANPTTMLYKLATPQEIDLGAVSDLPNLPSPDMSMWVDGTTIDAEWWTANGYETGSVTYRASTLEQDVNGLTVQLQGKVDSDEEWVSWMHAGTDATTHEPYLAMGQDSDYPSVVYGGSAARFYDGEGDADSNVVASFGAGGARIGRIGAAHQTQTSTQSLTYGPDGELVIVTKYQPITDSVSGNSKYGTRVTDEGNISYIDIYPAVSSSGFNDRLNLSAYMNNIDLSTTSGSELHLDNTYASIEAMETVSGTTYDNGLTLGFDSQNGYAPKISFSGTGAQAAWLAALGLTVEQSNMTFASGLNSSYGSAPVRKYGAMGILKLNSVRLASQLASGGSVVIGTLPTGYVPAGSVDMHINIESNSSNYRNNYITVEYSGSTNPGRVTLYNRSGYAIPNTVTFSCTCPFFI